MRLELPHEFGSTASRAEVGPAELEISDVPTSRGTVSLCVDEWPACEGQSAAVELTREHAKEICEHLIRVFGLLTLSPYGDAEKKPGSPKYGVPR